MVLRLTTLNSIPDAERRLIRFRRQTARCPKSGQISAVNDRHSNIAAGRAALWIAPWDTRHYPGRYRLLVEFLGRAYTAHGMLHWRRGTTPQPAWAARAWSAAIRARCAVGLAIANDLDAHAAAMEANPPHGANLRKDRAAGVAPSGIGARGKLFAKGDKETS
jgi:hypothetical protein